MSVMWTLMKKDWRVYRGPVVLLAAGAVFWCLVQITGEQRGFGGTLTFGGWYMPGGTAFTRFVTNWMPFFSNAYAAIVAAAFGAAAFAVERREGSANFLGTMPASRWEIVLSKYLVIYACFLVSGLWQELALSVLLHTNPAAILVFVPADWPPLGMGTFGVAWALSMTVRSASVAGIMAAAPLIVADALLWEPGDWQHMMQTGAIYGVIGAVLFVASTIWYLRRVAP